ncbi:MAG: hypothetical protein SGILL_000811, partial [Bacillariaceae sp.]
MMVGSFRQSLKTPTPARGQRQVLGDTNGQENARNRQTSAKGRGASTKSNLKTPPPAKASTMQNHGHIATTMTPTMAPTSANALRRTLQATIAPGEGLKSKPQSQTGSNFIFADPSPENQEKQETHRFSNGFTLAASSNNRILTSRFGPPQRVVPKTPNSLLRTEMDALDSSSSFSTQDESLLLSPPPGAVWNALNVSENRSVTATTGLVILSPQAAQQVHAWSSTKKTRSKESTSKRKNENERLSHEHPSPALPRTLSLQTPKMAKETVQHEEEELLHHRETVDDTETPSPQDGNISEEEKIVQKYSKGGVAMDLTDVFVTETASHQTKKNQVDKPIPKSTPLSASVPAVLVSRINNKRRAPPKSSRPTVVNTQKNAKPATTTQKSMHVRQKADSTAIPRKNSAVARKQKASDKLVPKSVLAENFDSARLGKPQQRVPKSSATSLTAKRNTTDTISVETRVEDSSSICKSDAVNSMRQSHRGGMAFEISFTDEKKGKSYAHKRDKARKDSEAKKKELGTTSRSWADKQSESFAGWLNFTFNPEEEERGDGNSLASGLRGLLIHRRLAQVRSKARDLFHSDEMRRTRIILVKEISRGRLSIREDRDITADIQLRRQLVSLLLSYTTPWLRMGLEVMFDECVLPVPMTENGPQVSIR